MFAKRVEELQVYQKALDGAIEISSIIGRESFRNDRRLCDQLGASSASVAALISEGFSLKTDRHFASHLYLARGSSSETRTHMKIARARNHVTDDELKQFDARYNEIERMLTGLIAHLNRENRQSRG